MEDIIWFANNFIVKNRQERFLSLIKKNDGDKIYHEINKLPSKLNNSCMAPTTDIYSFCRKMLDNHRTEKATGITLSFSEGLIITALKKQEIMDFINQDKDCFVIDRLHGTAFFKTHHGELWFCMSKRNEHE